MYTETWSDAPRATWMDAAESEVAPIGSKVGVRSLARNVSGVINDVVSTQRLVVVTKHGVPIAAIVPIGCLEAGQPPPAARGA